MENNIVEPPKPKKINYGNEAFYGGIISLILGASFLGWLVIAFTIGWGIRALKQDPFHKKQAVIGMSLAVIAVILGMLGIPGIFGLIMNYFLQGII